MRQTLSPPFGAPSPDRTTEDFIAAVKAAIADSVNRGSQIKLVNTVTGCSGAPVMQWGTGSDCHAAAAAGKLSVAAVPVGGSAILLAPASGRSYSGNEGYGSGTQQGPAVNIEIIDVRVNTTLRCVTMFPIVAEARRHPYFNIDDSFQAAPAGSHTIAPYTWQGGLLYRALKIEADDIWLWTIATGAVVFQLVYDWEHGGFGAPSRGFCPTLSHDAKTLFILQPREVGEVGTPFVNHISTVFDVESASPAIDYWTYSGPDDASYWGPSQPWGATTAASLGDSLAVVTGRPTMTGTSPANPTAMSIQLFDAPFTSLAAELDLQFTVSGISGVPLPIAGAPDGQYLVCGTWENVSGTATIRSLAVFHAPFVDGDVPIGVRTLAGYRIDNPECIKYSTSEGAKVLYIVWTKESDGTSWLGVIGAGGGSYPDPLNDTMVLHALGTSTAPVDYLTVDVNGARLYISRADKVQFWNAGTLYEYPQPGTTAPGVFEMEGLFLGGLTVGYTASAPSLVGGVRQRTLTIAWQYTSPEDLPIAHLVFPLPSGMTFVSATAGGTLETGPPAKVIWDLGALVSLDAGTVDLTVAY